MSINSIKRVKGFTLLELMVTVSIIAIISAMAWPFFGAQTMKNRRSDAVIALTRINNELNKFFSDNMTYAGYVVSPAINNGLTHYNINLNLAANTYTVTAAPFGSQANDADCATLTINNLGVKGYTGAAPSAARCWGSNN